MTILDCVIMKSDKVELTALSLLMIQYMLSVR